MAKNMVKTAHGARDIPMLALAWLAVALPLLWGVEQTIKKALALFR